MFTMANRSKYKEPQILLYSHEYDPITQLVLQNKKLFAQHNFYCVHIRELLNSNSEIFDQINMEEVSINWRLPNLKLAISNKNKIINRVHHVNKDWFEHFLPEYREYAFSEFWAYLNFALHSFDNISARPGGANCLLGNNLPLPMLWQKAKSLHINTPEFFVGQNICLPKTWCLDKIIIKDNIYDYYNWRPIYIVNPNFFTDVATYSLAVLRPTGIPVLVTQIQEHIMINSLEEQVDLSATNYQNILFSVKKAAAKLHKANNYWCSESLFFVDVTQQQFTFAMINNYMYAACYYNDKFVERMITKLLNV